LVLHAVVVATIALGTVAVAVATANVLL